MVRDREMEYWGAFFDQKLQMGLPEGLRVAHPAGPYLSPEEIRLKGYVRVEDTRERVIKTLNERFPAHSHQYKESGRKNRYRWSLTRREDLLTFLAWIEPHLHFKRAQALLLREFVNWKIEEDGDRNSASEEKKRRLVATEMEYGEKMCRLRRQVCLKPYMPSVIGLAALVDTSGGTQISRKSINTNGRFSYSVEERLQSPYVGMLDCFSRRYEGSGYTVTAHQTKEFDGPTYRWYAYGKVALTLLEDVEPSLRFRGPIISLAINFQEKIEELRQARDIARRSGDQQALEEAWRDYLSYGEQTRTRMQRLKKRLGK